MPSARTAASHSAKMVAKIANTGPLREAQSASLLEITGGDAAIVVIGFGLSEGLIRGRTKLSEPQRSFRARGAARELRSDATEASEFLQYSFAAAAIVRSLRPCDLICLPPNRMARRSPRERSRILQPTAEKRNQRGRLQDTVTCRLRFKRQTRCSSIGKGVRAGKPWPRCNSC